MALRKQGLLSLLVAVLAALASSVHAGGYHKHHEHHKEHHGGHGKDGYKGEVLFDESAVHVSSGSIKPHSVIIWFRCPTGFKGTPRVYVHSKYGGYASKAPKPSAASDYTGKFHAKHLKPQTKYSYYVKCGHALSAKAHFKTPPKPHQNTAAKFAWVADVAGQGYGRNADLAVGDIKGGFLFAEAVRREGADFVLFQGDLIYADGPIPPVTPFSPDLNGTALDYVKKAVGAAEFKNTFTKNFTAVTLPDFRKNWQYTFGDSKVKALLEAQPILATWDDHEVTNNWYPGEVITDPKYGGSIAADDLAATAKQALYEYYPIPDDEPLYGKVSYGKHLDVFLADMRSYRDANPTNNQTEGNLLGDKQEAYLTKALLTSKATWKVLALDGPVSIVVGGEGDWDAWAQGDNGAPLGREVQFARILKAAYDKGVTGLHVITSDVHYQGIINYNPKKAAFKHFTPFSEIIVGPCHAGAFGPNDDGVLDETFGGSYEYQRGPLTQEWNPFGVQNLPPPVTSGFGVAEVSEAGDLTFRIVDLDGSDLYTKTFEKP